MWRWRCPLPGLCQRKDTNLALPAPLLSCAFTHGSDPTGISSAALGTAGPDKDPGDCGSVPSPRPPPLRSPQLCGQQPLARPQPRSPGCSQWCHCSSPIPHLSPLRGPSELPVPSAAMGPLWGLGAPGAGQGWASPPPHPGAASPPAPSSCPSPLAAPPAPACQGLARSLRTRAG